VNRRPVGKYLAVGCTIQLTSIYHFLALNPSTNIKLVEFTIIPHIAVNNRHGLTSCNRSMREQHGAAYSEEWRGGTTGLFLFTSSDKSQEDGTRTNVKNFPLRFCRHFLCSEMKS